VVTNVFTGFPFAHVCLAVTGATPVSYLQGTGRPGSAGAGAAVVIGGSAVLIELDPLSFASHVTNTIGANNQKIGLLAALIGLVRGCNTLLQCRHVKVCTRICVAHMHLCCCFRVHGHLMPLR
jgi:hypothetical protein